MPDSTELPDKKRLNVICRPASIKDTPDVMDLTCKIWDGEDYVPAVWTEWLCDATGELAVAECDNRVIGLGKLTRLSSEDWWLETLKAQGLPHSFTITYWTSGSIKEVVKSVWQPPHSGIRFTIFANGPVSKKLGSSQFFR